MFFAELVRLKWLVGTFLFLCMSFSLVSAQSKGDEPYVTMYEKYKPDFIDKINKSKNWKPDEKEMERSSEKQFYTLNEIELSSRAIALVKAAVENEDRKDYRKAMGMYQTILTKFNVVNNYNEVLFNVSEYGVYVPISQYCQKRLLKFPIEELNFYRTLYDPEAQELFDEAVKNYSLDLFSEITNRYLATSYGGKSLMVLGDASMDKGNFLGALEYYETIKDFIPDPDLKNKELDLKIQLCQNAIGQKKDGKASGNGKSALTAAQMAQLAQFVQNTKYVKPKVFSQKASAQYVTVDDYTQMPPSKDPMGLLAPYWQVDLLGTRNDFHVYAQPVVTNSSILMRHKNIIYCYSLLTGLLRWKNDLGGRANWQNWFEREYYFEDIVVQDGVVISPMIKGGKSLVAIDEITGQIKWSYGPMSAPDGDESLMRFESSPTCGPGTVYATYILDNIKGDTHIDSEYGVIALDTITGRVKWRRQVCRLQPGKFDGSFGSARKNRIRSFGSPPLYNEGTIYVNTNAGALAAMDALSGRLKWLSRYPYFKGVHDLTRQYGKLTTIHGGMSYVHPHSPSFWFNQRPLVFGEKLIITPVDTPFMFCLDRQTGMIDWTYYKPTGGFSHVVGLISTDELVISGNGRATKDWRGNTDHPIYLVDLKTGKETWKAPDVIYVCDNHVLNYYAYNSPAYFKQKEQYYETAARPFLSSDDKIILSQYTDRSIYWRRGVYMFNMAVVDLKNKKVEEQRRYLSGATLAHCDYIINDEGPKYLESLKKLANPTKEQKEQIVNFEKVVNEEIPVNENPEFMNFSRSTFTKFGIPFELRLSARKLMVVYDRKLLESKLKGKSDLESVFALAELALMDGQYEDASRLLNQSIKLVSPEDVNFRSLIKQQFYRVYKELVKTAIRSNQKEMELTNALGMSNTASVLSEEIESLFALAEAYESNAKFDLAASCLRNLIEIYGHHEYPVSSLALASVYDKAKHEDNNKTANEVFDNAQSHLGDVYGEELGAVLALMRRAVPLYSSTVSPLHKENYVRTGDYAIKKLEKLLATSGNYKASYSDLSKKDLVSEKIEELVYHIWKYPGTAVGQSAIDKITALAGKLGDEEKRDYYRKIGHMADVCNFKQPAVIAAFSEAPKYDNYKAVDAGKGEKEYEFKEFKEPVIQLMNRKGDRSISPNLAFFSIRLPKRVGNKFSLVCFDLSAGKEVWRKEEFRLKDLGKEPGFFSAFVHKDLVVVHGIYDVFGFSLSDGKEVWRYSVPHSFEIQNALISGNIFVITGQNETIALQVDTKSTIGEVAWQQREEGKVYHPSYFYKNHLVSVRMSPFNITVRHRNTGSLITRIEIPDMLMFEDHPMFGDKKPGLPVADSGRFIALTDGEYLYIYDAEKMRLHWKVQFLNNNSGNDPLMRLAISDKYVIVLKDDYGNKAVYGYELSTGKLLWFTDNKDSKTPRPFYDAVIVGDIVYGLKEHSGQGFIVTAYNIPDGKHLYSKSYDGYSEKPLLIAEDRLYGDQFILKLQDRKNFEIIAINTKDGSIVKKVQLKGDGPIGDPGRISITIQNGHPVLFSKMMFKY